ncbi:MAG: thiamine-phosphate kinase, partial [Alphaproteobacteria bacterium]
GLKDEVALLQPPAGQDLVLTTDMLLGGVHFLDDPPDTIARKALRVNLSDLNAKGAIARGYLLALGLTDAIDETWIAQFCGGLASDQKHYDVALFGGDTASGPGPLTISITAFGFVPTGRALLRSAARPGDAIFVTGEIGNGWLGLQARRGKFVSSAVPGLAGLYLLPDPPVGFGARLIGLARAAMDVSDGLLGDLAHICETSRVAAVVDAARVPLLPALEQQIRADADLFMGAVTGGDDYQVLFTAPVEREAELTRLAGAARVKVTRIGRIEAGAGVRLVAADGRPIPVKSPGFRHF